MYKLNELTNKVRAILNRCDGGQKYPFDKAIQDMEQVITEIEAYHSKSATTRFLVSLLKREAESWIENWKKMYRIY